VKKGEVRLTISGDPKKLESALNRSSRHIQQYSKHINRTEKHITTFGKKSINTFRKVGPSIRRSFGGIKGIVGTMGLVAAGKKVMDYEKRLFRLAAQANVPKKRILELRKELFDMGKATHQKPGELLSYIEAIVERTGNFDFAVQSLKDMGRVGTASGAAMGDLGATAANLQQKLGIIPKQLFQMFDILASQGEHGAFTLQNMANLFERLLSAGVRFNIKGVEGMRKFGAFLQIAKQGTGTAEQATTAVEGVIRELLQLDKIKKIIKLTGFKVFDEDEYKKSKKIILKDFDVVLKEIVRRTEGNEIKLGQIFGQESIRAIAPLARIYRETGSFEQFDKFIKMGGDGSQIMKDFNLMASATATKVKDFGTKLHELLDTKFAKPVEKFGNALEKFTAFLEKIERSEGGVGWKILEDLAAPYAIGPVAKDMKIGHPQGFGWEMLRGLAETYAEKISVANDIDLTVNIQKDRITAETNDMKTKVKVNLPRGEF
jgi:TP901 family phage tail tape measure protein